MKKLLSLLTLLSTLGFASLGFTQEASASVFKHSKHIKHTTAIKRSTVQPSCVTGPSSSIYQNGDCSSCAMDAAASFDMTPLGEAYARMMTPSPLVATAPIALPDQLALVEPTVVPVYVMPEHTILLTDSTYASYTPHTTTVGGFAVTSTGNPLYYSPFRHHYSDHNSKGYDKTRESGISPRAGTLPESFGTMLKEQ